MVTASVDTIAFHNPVPVGAVVVLVASVNFTGRTSMEVGVKVWHEDRATGARKHVVSAYLTFVSLDPATRLPAAVAPVLPETTDERRRYADAQRRREARLALRDRTR